MIFSSNKFFFLDTETTGPDPTKHDPFQIAGVLFHKPDIDSSKIVNFTVRPINTENISQEALEITGKSFSEIMEYQNPIIACGDFVKKLEKLCNKYDKKDKFCIVGYNAKFDQQMLRSWFFNCGQKYFGSFFFSYVIDLYSISQQLFFCGKLNGIENLKLESVYQYLFKDSFNAHDALDDIVATFKIYEYYRQKFGILLPDVGALNLTKQ